MVAQSLEYVDSAYIEPNTAADYGPVDGYGTDAMPFNELADAGQEEPLPQVTSVSQLSDVQPTDWAFQALQSLVERYGCIAGFPDGTYRGNRATTRYEFAAGLNACLDRVLEIVGSIDADDLETIKRLQEEFAAELATLRGRVDSLEARTAELEANQFSTTTKLVGEVAFAITDTFTPGEGDPTETVFNDRIRLQLVSSFSGKDSLFTRITAGNIGDGFATELGTFEGRFANDGLAANDFVLDRLHYVFPIGEDLRVTVQASLGGHHFYADTFNPGLEAGGGSSGAITRFAERNPIYRLGLGGQGIGFRYTPDDLFGIDRPFLEVSAGYLAPGGFEPDEGLGLFNGNYSAFGQLVIKPTKNLKLGFVYLNSFDVAADGDLDLGLTGTNFGRLLFDSPTGDPDLGDIGVDTDAIDGILTNTYGLQLQFDPVPWFSFRAWGGLIRAELIDFGDADILNYSASFVFNDLLGEGNQGAIIVGTEPYLIDLDGPGVEDFSEEAPIQLNFQYKYRLTDNILLTPGVIVLLAPNQDADLDDQVIAILRSTFTF
ncbi:MAG: iron uptake porin [Cyanothece sp. SIO1E1]|nr:iron uptake porin [Cyanothece sp. SIO1E1]